MYDKVMNTPLTYTCIIIRCTCSNCVFYNHVDESHIITNVTSKVNALFSFTKFNFRRQVRITFFVRLVTVIKRRTADISQSENIYKFKII